MNRWIRYIATRLLYMALTLFVIASVTFFLMSTLPGTPYNNQDKLTELQLATLNVKYGFDKPLLVRYGNYMRNILHGDFGISLQFSDQPVASLLGSRIGPSIQLGLQAVVFGTIIGTIMGAIAAMKQNTFVDVFCQLFAITGRSVPNFVVAVILQFIFAVTLNWLPIGLWNDGFRSTILPTLALSISPMADAARFIRTEMVEVLSSDYIELARAKGMGEIRIAFTHGLRNALIPLITFLQDAWRRLRKNKAAVFCMTLLLVIILIALLAPVLAPYPPNEQHIPYANLPPCIPGVSIPGVDGTISFRGNRVDRYAMAGVPDDVNFLFGTDEFGRDLFSRTLYGTRISLLIAFVAVLLDLSIGVVYGLTSAMKGGRADLLMQRILEMLSGIPSLVLVVLMLLVFEPGVFSIILALVISSWIPMARVVRAQTLRIKQMEYVQAARALGCTNAKIALSHVLPNISGVVIVRAMFSIPSAIFFETFLSFLGVGMKIPNASLGTLLNGGYKVFKLYPYQMFIPAAILCVIMLSFNLFADGLRDAFDPKMKE